MTAAHLIALLLLVAIAEHWRQRVPGRERLGRLGEKTSDGDGQ